MALKSKKDEIPHPSQWTIIKEEFEGTWKPVGETYLHSMVPLMEVTRCQNINGVMFVVTSLEWGSPLRFFGNDIEANGVLSKNHFLLETTYRARAALQGVLPEPKCRPTVNFLEESDRQLGRKQKK